MLCIQYMQYQQCSDAFLFAMFFCQHYIYTKYMNVLNAISCFCYHLIIMEINGILL